MLMIKELQKIIQQGENSDAILVPNTSTRNLNLGKIDAYFQRYNIEFEQEADADKARILLNTDILAESGEVTVGGLLVFGQNVTRHLPQAYVSFAHFRGDEITSELLDKQSIEGTLDYQIDTSVSIIKNHWPVSSVINGTRREDTSFIYNDGVFRELIANACLHRNYALQSQIRIFMFADRIEFRSPGRLPNAVNVEKLRYGVSSPVNPIILKFMDNLRYVDRLGRGLPMVYHEATSNGKRVDFQVIGEEFWVTLER